MRILGKAKGQRSHGFQKIFCVLKQTCCSSWSLEALELFVCMSLCLENHSYGSFVGLRHHHRCGCCFDADKSCAQVQRGEFLRQTNISFCPAPASSKFGYNFFRGKPSKRIPLNFCDPLPDPKTWGTRDPNTLIGTTEGHERPFICLDDDLNLQKK